MRYKKLLASVLLGVGVLFVSTLGYGEVKRELYKKRGMPLLSWRLLQATVHYMEENPDSFLKVDISYDEDGTWGRFSYFLDTDWLPGYVDTKGKICLLVGDNIFREDGERVFCGKSGTGLLNEFKRQLEIIYPFIERYATDMDTDIVASFYTRERKPSLPVPLGYFYQGEYYLWGEG